MRKLVSISGWNTQVFKRELVPGDYVAFRMCKDNILRVGVVVDKGKQAVKCLTDNKIYFPYSQDVLLFNENCVIKGLTSKIVEV